MLRQLAILILLTGFIDAATAAKLYRWVDDNGNVYYSDRVPPEYARQERARLNQHGVYVERTEAAKSESEIQQEQELARLREAQDHILEEQQARDRVLLTTFRSEGDILITRDSKLSTVESQMAIAKSTIDRLTERLAAMQTEAASRERKGEKSSKAFLTEIETTRRQIEDKYRLIAQRETENQMILEKFDQDLKRFTELKRLVKKNAPESTDSSSSRVAVLDTLIECQGSTECQLYWKNALDYAQRHATTPTQVISERIMVTSTPVLDKDLALSVSRIRGDAGNEQIFLDVQCRDSALGQEFCNSDPVIKIRKGFRAAISAR